VRRIRETRERREIWGEESFGGRRRLRDQRELEREKEIVGCDFGWQINLTDGVK
jgi:hypothetical protein